MEIKKQELAEMMDHTILKIEADYSKIEKICQEAIDYNFVSVAIHPANIVLAKNFLKDTSVKITAALGFYLGVYPAEIKRLEVRNAVDKGADELDMVINVAALKDKKYKVIEDEVKGLVEEGNGRITKLILETEILEDNEIIEACKIGESLGVSFIKTSTGFREIGATVHAVELIRKTVSQETRIKASGGIRTLDDALKMIKAGATRLGLSASVKIMQEWDMKYNDKEFD